MAGTLAPSSPRWTGRRAVVILAVCQALAVTGQVVMVTLSSLVGYDLATDKSFATLPVALQLTGMMLGIVPASLFMKRHGRRAGFLLGTCIGLVGAAVAATAVLRHEIGLYTLGSFLFGSSVGFNHFYRHAAADAAPESYRSRAISWVLAGGLIAAFIAPMLATWSRDKIPDHAFAGSIIAIALLQFATLLVLTRLRLPMPSDEERTGKGRPLREIMRQRAFIVAVLTAAGGYSVMAFVMTATPLAVTGHGHSFADSAFVIQWHVVGMFAPSFFTGHLIQRFGVRSIMTAGALATFGTVLVGLSGTEVAHFWGALLLVGVGWNFMFIGGTTLLGSTHSPAEKAKTQAANDFIVFGSVALASFLSGFVYTGFGWSAIAAAIVPMLVVVLIATMTLKPAPTPIPALTPPKTSSHEPPSPAPDQV